ncbi:hypothetical protein CFK37_01940 [Virgibacillus phasianinus]|uniref:Uncharacterized protein n=1 Tax=Virgibacillus phasianinus TaxID=2017483 RepID=A0A220TZI3_9BACI|nr:hypothetical protein CFK37_01940 [Virgibacillus phasianinus]
MCAGEFNIPGREVYTAPAKNSVNGTISYNTPCPYQGKIFQDVVLTFKDGKIYFDDVLIRDNGIFVLDSLQAINSENLM